MEGGFPPRPPGGMIPPPPPNRQGGMQGAAQPPPPSMQLTPEQQQRMLEEKVRSQRPLRAIVLCSQRDCGLMTVTAAAQQQTCHANITWLHCGWQTRFGAFRCSLTIYYGQLGPCWACLTVKRNPPDRLPLVLLVCGGVGISRHACCAWGLGRGFGSVLLYMLHTR